MSSMMPPSPYPQGVLPAQGAMPGLQGFMPGGAIPPQALTPQYGQAIAGQPPGGPQAPPGQQMGMAPQPPQPGQPGMPGQLDPQMVQAMLMMNRYAGQEKGFDRQRAMAEKLRGGIAETMASKSPINTPNWAGALAGVSQAYRAGQLERGAQRGQEELTNQRISDYEKFLKGYKPSQV